MSRLLPLGRLLVAIAFVAFGIEHFVFGQFVVGRAPAWPEGVPGGLAWAWATGIVFIASGSAILAGWHARAAALVAAVLILGWALLRHIPVFATDMSFGSDWTRAGKALALFGGSLLIAGSMRALSAERPRGIMAFLNSEREFEYIGRVALGAFLVLTGIQHFLFEAFVSSLVPTWIPGALFWTYFAGVALIAGGLGVMIPQTVRLAGTLTGIMIFVWFVILHIPRALASTGDGNEWIAVVEALAMSGIAFMLAGYAHLGKVRSDERVLQEAV